MSRTTTTIPTKSQPVSGPQADIAAGSRDGAVEESCRTVRRPEPPRQMTPSPSEEASRSGGAFGHHRMTASSVVELPGIEPASLAGLLPSELLFRYVSFRFSPVRYLRSRSRALTASIAVSR
jgi:hypothetical protein